MRQKEEEREANLRFTEHFALESDPDFRKPSLTLCVLNTPQTAFYASELQKIRQRLSLRPVLMWWSLLQTSMSESASPNPCLSFSNVDVYLASTFKLLPTRPQTSALDSKRSTPEVDPQAGFQPKTPRFGHASTQTPSPISSMSIFSAAQP